jgi:hypothetical protein
MILRCISTVTKRYIEKMSSIQYHFLSIRVKNYLNETIIMNQTNCNQGTKISNYELSFEAVRERPWVVMTSYGTL